MTAYLGLHCSHVSYPVLVVVVLFFLFMTRLVTLIAECHCQKKKKIMSVKVYQTLTLILKYFSCNSHEGPILSLQEGKKNITTLQK